MSDTAKHLANQLLYHLQAKTAAGAQAPQVHQAPHPHIAQFNSTLPKHVLDHAIDYIDKIKVAKSRT